jgi:hypothetical protein
MAWINLSPILHSVTRADGMNKSCRRRKTRTTQSRVPTNDAPIALAVVVTESLDRGWIAYVVSGAKDVK